MATGRMLNKSICIDKAVHELSSDTCRLAFSWAITHLDRDGRMPGDPKIVKAWVLPLRDDITSQHIEGFIKEWMAKQLVQWYEARGDKWLWFPKFHQNQPKLRYDREAESKIPAPEEAGPTPDLLPPIRREENLKEENRMTAESPPSVSLVFPKPEHKTQYGEAVSMTSAQYQKLVDKYGSETVGRAVDKLSTYKLSSGRQYKSDYHAMLQWVFNAIGAKARTPAKPVMPIPKDERDESVGPMLADLVKSRKFKRNA